jgi:hypothetical protein
VDGRKALLREKIALALLSDDLADEVQQVFGANQVTDPLLGK